MPLRRANADQVADQPQAPEHAGGEQDDGSDKRALSELFYWRWLVTQSIKAGTRRVEG